VSDAFKDKLRAQLEAALTGDASALSLSMRRLSLGAGAKGRSPAAEPGSGRPAGEVKRARRSSLTPLAKMAALQEQPAAAQEQEAQEEVAQVGMRAAPPRLPC
jgi:hypothetical protein